MTLPLGVGRVLADAGPGVVWLPFLLVAILVAAALWAAVPPDEAARWRWAWPRGQRTGVEPRPEADEQVALATGRRAVGAGLVGWLLVAALVVLLLLLVVLVG